MYGVWGLTRWPLSCDTSISIACYFIDILSRPTFVRRLCFHLKIFYGAIQIVLLLLSFLRAKVLGYLSVQSVSKISNLCDHNPTTSQTDVIAISIPRYMHIVDRAVKACAIVQCMSHKHQRNRSRRPGKSQMPGRAPSDCTPSSSRQRWNSWNY